MRRAIGILFALAFVLLALPTVQASESLDQQQSIPHIMLPCYLQTRTLSECADCVDAGGGIYDANTEAELCIEHIAPLPWGADDNAAQTNDTQRATVIISSAYRTPGRVVVFDLTGSDPLAVTDLMRRFRLNEFDALSFEQSIPFGACDSDKECKQQIGKVCTVYGEKAKEGRVLQKGEHCAGECMDGTGVDVYCVKEPPSNGDLRPSW